MNKQKNLKQTILQKFDDLPTKEKKVAEYIIDNYDNISHFNSIELADAIGVSDTTVIRFSKRIGFKGFSQFKDELRSEALHERRPYAVMHEMTLEADNEVVSNYISYGRKDMDDFLGKLDTGLIDKIADELLNAHRVYLFGLGCDRVVSEFLLNYLPLCGVRCVNISEQGLSMREKAMFMQNNDLLFISSSPKQEDDEFWLTEYCSSNGIPVILMTDSEITAQKMAPMYTVYIKPSYETFFHSKVIPMMFCDLILLSISRKNPSRVEKMLKKHYEINDI